MYHIISRYIKPLAVVCWSMILFLSGCCAPCRAYQKLQRPLVGTTWQLIQLEGRNISAPAGSFQLRFSTEGELTGMGACNRLMATYVTSGDRELRIGPAASTRMRCGENAALEQTFFALLGRITHYDMDGPMLLLLSDGSLLALLEAVPTEQPQQ